MLYWFQNCYQNYNLIDLIICNYIFKNISKRYVFIKLKYENIPVARSKWMYFRGSSVSSPHKSVTFSATRSTKILEKEKNVGRLKTLTADPRLLGFPKTRSLSIWCALILLVSNLWRIIYLIPPFLVPSVQIVQIFVSFFSFFFFIFQLFKFYRFFFDFTLTINRNSCFVV